MDTTKFFFSYRLEATGQVAEYARTEISSDRARAIFRLITNYPEVLNPPSIKDDRAQVEADKKIREKAKIAKAKEIKKRKAK